jgi:hypothetical protein
MYSIFRKTEYVVDKGYSKFSTFCSTKVENPENG